MTLRHHKSNKLEAHLILFSLARDCHLVAPWTPVFVNKILLEHSHAFSFTSVCDCCAMMMAELNNCVRDTQSLECLLAGLFRKKFADSYYKLLIFHSFLPEKMPAFHQLETKEFLINIAEENYLNIFLIYYLFFFFFFGPHANSRFQLTSYRLDYFTNLLSPLLVASLGPVQLFFDTKTWVMFHISWFDHMILLRNSSMMTDLNPLNSSPVFVSSNWNCVSLLFVSDEPVSCDIVQIFETFVPSSYMVVLILLQSLLLIVFST